MTLRAPAHARITPPRELVAYPNHAGVLRHFDSLSAGGVVLGAHACTFAELVADVMHAALPDARIATPLERRLLVLRALGELDGLSVPAPGLLGAAEEALRACLRSGALAETVLRVAEAPDGKRPRLRRLGHLLKAYEKACEGAGLVDPDRALWTAAQALASGASTPALVSGLEQLTVRGVVQLSRAELALLHRLSLRLTPQTQVVLEVPHVEGAKAYRMVTRLHERFAEFGNDGVIELRSVEPFASDDDAGGDHPGVRTGERVARALLALEGGGAAASAAPAEFGWLVAADPLAEARAAANFIRGVLERSTPAGGPGGGSTSPERVAVITRAPAEGRALLEDALDEAGVPVARERRHQLAAVPIVRFVLDVVHACTVGWTTEDISNLLDSDYARQWVPEGRRELSQYLRRMRLPRQLGAAWFVSLPERVRSGSGASPSTLAAAQRVALTLASFAESSSSAAFFDAVDGILGNAGLDEIAVFKGSPPPRLARLLRGEGSRLARDEAEAFGLDQRALEALRDLIREWRSAAAAAELPPRPAEEWATLFAAAAGGVTLFGATGAANGVRVIAPDAAALGDFDAAVIAGLEHGVFPSGPRESALLRHEDAARLAHEVELRSAFDVWGDGLGEPYRGGEEVDRVLFLLVLSAVRGPLLLSRAATDTDGGVVLASEFFEATEHAFPRAERRDLEGSAARDVDTLALGFGRPLRQATLRAAAGVPPGTSPAGLLELAAPGSGGDDASVDPNLGSTVVARARMERGRLARALGAVPTGATAKFLSAFDGRTEAVPSVASEERPLGVTATENAVACPFRFFAGHVLGLRAEEGATFDPDRRDQGTASHEAFGAAIALLQREGVLPFAPERADAAVALVDARVREVIEARTPRDGVRGETRERNVARLAREVLDVIRALYEGEERGWNPVHTEWSFGDARHGGGVPALAVPLDDGTTAHFGGRADFVERNGDAWRVSDLKATAAKRLTEKQLHATNFGHSSLQLPIYVAKLAEHTSSPKVSARYLSLADGEAVERPAPPRNKGASKDAFLPDEELYALTRADGSRTTLAETLREVVTRMRAGEFAATPRPGACDHCDYRGLCRRPMAAAAEEEAGE